MKKVQIPWPAFKTLHNLVSIYLFGLIFFPQVHSYSHFLSQVMLVLASAHVTSSRWTAFQPERSDSSFKLRQNYPFPMRSHLTLPCPSGSSLHRILEEWVLHIAAITLYWVLFSPQFQSKFSDARDQPPSTSFAHWSLTTHCNMMMHMRRQKFWLTGWRYHGTRETAVN